MTRKKAVPRVPYFYLMSHMLNFARDPLRAMEAIIQKPQFSDLFQINMIFQRLNWIANPDYADYVLNKHPYDYTRDNMFNQTVRNLFGNNLAVSDGDIWKRHRWYFQPEFTADTADTYLDTMIETINHELDTHWQAKAGNGTINLLPEILNITNRVMACLMFGKDVDSTVSDAIGNGLEIREKYTGLFLVLSFLPKQLVPGYRNFHKADKQINDAFLQQIREHRAQGEKAKGILGKLINIVDANGNKLSDEAIRIELGGIFVGGRDATGAATSWLLYLLDQHQEFARVVQDEIRTVLGDKTPTLELLHQLPQTQNAVNEALRLYPAVWFAAPRSNLLADDMYGYQLKAKSLNFVNLFLMHRNPNIWEDADRYIPSRFETLTDLQKRAFRPFAYMPHQCLGKYMAQLEIQLICTLILQRYQIKLLSPKPMDKIPYDLRTTVRPGNPIPATLSLVN